MPVVFAHTSLLSQLVVLPLSGQHRPPHAESLPQKMGHMTSTLLVICRYTFYRTRPRESDTSLPRWEFKKAFIYQKQERELFYAITTIIFSHWRDPQSPGERSDYLQYVFPPHVLREWGEF